MTTDPYTRLCQLQRAYAVARRRGHQRAARVLARMVKRLVREANR